EKIPKDIFQLQKKIFTRTDLLTSAGKNVSEDIEIQNLEGEQQLKSEEEEATYEFLNKWNRGWKIKEYFKSNKNDENRNFIEKNVRIVKSARFVLNAIQTYLLPLLYGLLGAFAFVFRSLSDELKTSSFTEESVINYRLQIALGILSGLAIGWFFVRTGDETGFSIRSLSPLALAFLAGYSVELLFSIMDKLISAFSIKKQ
ncbi:MAG: hypothetical protein KAS32_05960, partial [Candidatus Peribacteraceae bacterium]|nr:hypothetical protein [Candidatus Peribacteraceae bacterium]